MANNRFVKRKFAVLLIILITCFAAVYLIAKFCCGKSPQSCERKIDASGFSFILPRGWLLMESKEKNGLGQIKIWTSDRKYAVFFLSHLCPLPPNKEEVALDRIGEYYIQGIKITDKNIEIYKTGDDIIAHNKTKWLITSCGRNGKILKVYITKTKKRLYSISCIPYKDSDLYEPIIKSLKLE